MITFSVAWILVTIIKQPQVKEFEFNPAIVLFAGIIDFFIVAVVASAIAG